MDKQTDQYEIDKEKLDPPYTIIVSNTSSEVKTVTLFDAYRGLNSSSQTEDPEVLIRMEYDHVSVDNLLMQIACKPIKKVGYLRIQKLSGRNFDTKSFYFLEIQRDANGAVATQPRGVRLSPLATRRADILEWHNTPLEINGYTAWEFKMDAGDAMLFDIHPLKNDLPADRGPGPSGLLYPL